MRHSYSKILFYIAAAFLTNKLFVIEGLWLLSGYELNILLSILPHTKFCTIWVKHFSIGSVMMLLQWIMYIQRQFDGKQWNVKLFGSCSKPKNWPEDSRQRRVFQHDDARLHYINTWTNFSKSYKKTSKHWNVNKVTCSTIWECGEGFCVCQKQKI